MAYESEKQIAIAATTAAAQLCEQVRQNRSPDAIQKQDCSPVTVADYAAQAVICHAIATAFTEDAIVGEENTKLLRQPEMADRLAQVTHYVKTLIPTATPEQVADWIDRGSGQVGPRYWTLDPIDGTKGFLRGDQYAIALALIENGQVQVGVMACPALPWDVTQPEVDRGVLFVAVRGQGACRIALGSGKTEAIRVSTAEDAGYRLIESVELDHGNPSRQMAVAQAIGLTATPIQMDSLAKYGVVACGQAALYLRLPWAGSPDYRENIWDHAAGTIVLQEAGGCISDVEGKPLDFSVGAKLLNNRGIIASQGTTLHKAVLEALGKV